MGPNQTFRLVTMYGRYMYLAFVIKFSLSLGNFFILRYLFREGERKQMAYLNLVYSHIMALVSPLPSVEDSCSGRRAARRLSCKVAAAAELGQVSRASEDIRTKYRAAFCVLGPVRCSSWMPADSTSLLDPVSMLLYLVGCWYWQGELSNGINCGFSIILSLRNDFTNTLASDCLYGLASAVFMLWRL